MTASVKAAADGSKAIIKVNGIDRLLVHESGLLEATVSPARFANNKQLATTEAVREALGSFASALSYTGNTTLTENAVGKPISINAAGIDLVLPLASSVPSGATIMVFGNGLAGTVSRQGADLIQSGSAGSITSIAVGAYDVAMFINMGGIWYLLGGEAHQKVSSAFGSSLSANGYQKLPSGLILQWGVTAGVTTSIAITFPIAFPNGVLGTGYGGKISSDAATYNGVGFNGISTTGMTFFTGTGTAGAGVRWFAIGY